MFADLRVPVERSSVEMLTIEGSRHSLVVFHAPGQGLEGFVEASDAFFPAHEAEAFRLFARANVVALSSELTFAPALPADDLPETRRLMRVHLRGGSALVGEIHYVACEGAARPIDHLNENSTSFRLFTQTRVHHIVKAHVLFVEEL
jgi:hypothetical protein